HESGRTVDVMRFVLTYSLDHNTISEGNKPVINKKVEEAIRSLIKDMVKYSKDELDFEASKQVPSVHPNTSQQQYHRPMNLTTQDNWNCPKCKFLNFAKHVKCMRCNGLLHKRSDRSGNSCDDIQLKRGDWLCVRISSYVLKKDRAVKQMQVSKFCKKYKMFAVPSEPVGEAT
ncbi:zinc finger, RanBP2-type containing protein, partial [Tanacetum coccineum]